VKAEIEDIIGLPADDAVLASAKTGVGIDETLEAIVARIPPPKGDADAPLKAMLVDSWYDPYLGVVILIRVIDGAIKKGQQIKFMATGTTHLVDRVGVFRPKIEQLAALGPGEVGFITAQIKEVAQTAVGDTITLGSTDVVFRRELD
jgi:GTP-binding protein LepA